MKKRNSRLLACALAVVLCMTAFSIPTFAAGYYASNENGNNTPPDAIESITVSTENVNLPANSSASGIPALTPDGNLTSIDDILQSAASVSTEDIPRSQRRSHHLPIRSHRRTLTTRFWIGTAT